MTQATDKIIESVVTATGLSKELLFKKRCKKSPFAKVLLIALLLEDGWNYKTIKKLIGFSSDRAISRAKANHTLFMRFKFKNPTYVEMYQQAKTLAAA